MSLLYFLLYNFFFATTPPKIVEILTTPLEHEFKRHKNFQQFFEEFRTNFEIFNFSSTIYTNIDYENINQWLVTAFRKIVVFGNTLLLLTNLV